MGYTEAQIINRISTVLQDAGTVKWGTAEIRQGIDDGLIEIARYRPRIVMATVTTSSGTKEVDISGVSSLLHGYDEESFEAVEFRIDKDPIRKRNYEINGTKMHLKISFSPDASENVRLYTRQKHVLDGTVTNTLDPELERLCIDLVASRLAINKGMSYVDKVPLGGSATFGQTRTWGQDKLAQTLTALRGLKRINMDIEYPEDV